MKKKCIVDQNGNIINIGPWNYEEETIVETGESIIRNPIPKGASEEEREIFIGRDGGFYAPKSPIVEAENFIARYFSIAQLLQMKVWLDNFPHEKIPKLKSVYEWINGVTLTAVNSSADFNEPPHPFKELASEFSSLQ